MHADKPCIRPIIYSSNYLVLSHSVFPITSAGSQVYFQHRLGIIGPSEASLLNESYIFHFSPLLGDPGSLGHEATGSMVG